MKRIVNVPHPKWIYIFEYHILKESTVTYAYLGQWLTDNVGQQAPDRYGEEGKWYGEFRIRKSLDNRLSIVTYYFKYFEDCLYASLVWENYYKE